MQRATSSYLVCCLRVMMACLARRRPTVFAAQGTCAHVMPDVVQPYVQSKVYDCMLRPTPSDRVFCPRAMITCHMRHRLTLYVVQER